MLPRWTLDKDYEQFVYDFLYVSPVLCLFSIVTIVFYLQENRKYKKELHVEEKTDTIMQNYVFFAVKNIKPSLN
jgi:hypothetical protein